MSSLRLSLRHQLKLPALLWALATFFRSLFTARVSWGDGGTNTLMRVLLNKLQSAVVPVAAAGQPDLSHSQLGMLINCGCLRLSHTGGGLGGKGWGAGAVINASRLSNSVFFFSAESDKEPVGIMVRQLRLRACGGQRHKWMRILSLMTWGVMTSSWRRYKSAASRNLSDSLLASHVKV